MKSNQRGSIENVVGVLRKHITRKTNLEELSDKKLKEIENQINKMPRKIFDYRSSFDIYYGKKVALANGF